MAYQIGDKYYHNDIESGAMVEISKETFDAMNESMDYFKKYLKTGRENKGNIIIYSTPADEDFDGSDKNRNFWNDWNDKK